MSVGYESCAPCSSAGPTPAAEKARQETSSTVTEGSICLLDLPTSLGEPLGSFSRQVSTGSTGHFQHVFNARHHDSLDKHYELTDILGEGAFGKIFKAISKDFHEEEPLSEGCAQSRPPRAVKTISRGSKPEEFETEVVVQKKLDHPNIAKLYEVFYDKVKYYLVLELCTGGELFDKVVKAGGSFGENQAATYVRQLLSAINYLHNSRVVHRDIKPENMLLHSDADESPLKLIDFGIARAFQPGQVLNTCCGTPLYISPQVLAKHYDEKCDVWSCGVIMYVLLCGSAPFFGRDEQDLLKKVQKGTFDFDDEEWDDVSDAAKALIRRMMTFDPVTRPSADILLDDAWLMGGVELDQGPLPENLVSKLRAFKAVSYFKKIALSLAAQLMSDEDIRDMQRTFLALDKNKDGVLSHAEIADGLASHGIALPSDLAEIIENVDTDGSGCIDYTEFIASTISRKHYLREEVLWSAFRTFDLDGDGKITREEFMQVVDLSDQSDIIDIFGEADTNGDGVVDFVEFCSIMRSSTVDSPALGSRAEAVVHSFSWSDLKILK